MDRASQPGAATRSDPREGLGFLQDAAALAVDYLQQQNRREAPVVRHATPEELARALALEPGSSARPPSELLAELDSLLHFSVHTGHPHFFNQLFGGFDPAAIAGEWLAAALNTSMYTFEVAPVLTLIELALLRRMSRMLGHRDGEGVLVAGGSLSNLMAVLLARHAAFPDVKQKGWPDGARPVMLLSEEAHYSLTRAASVIGLGSEAAVPVPTDDVGAMRVDALERLLTEAKDKGRRPFLVAATCGTTVAGAFDPLNEIAELAGRFGAWLHVDASYGGSVLFSRRHRELLSGVHRADSVAWNPHKMMGVPLACAALLTRERGVLQQTMGMGADYLFHGQQAGPYDLGDMSLHCGRRADALKLWLSWQAQGDDGFERRVDDLFELARSLVDELRGRPGFELVREPQSTNVCFRYLPRAARDAPAERRLVSQHRATIAIRDRLSRGGKFLINYAEIDGAASFRLVASHPGSTRADLCALLDEIARLGEQPDVLGEASAPAPAATEGHAG